MFSLNKLNLKSELKFSQLFLSFSMSRGILTSNSRREIFYETSSKNYFLFYLLEKF